MVLCNGNSASWNEVCMCLYRFIYFQSSFEGFGIPFLIADFWALCLIVLNGLSEIFSALKREDVNKSDNKYVFMIW